MRSYGKLPAVRCGVPAPPSGHPSRGPHHGYTDADGAPFEFSIDRKVDESGLLFIRYDEHTRQSTLTFPYPLSGKPLVVSRYHHTNTAAAVPPGYIFPVLSHSGNTATVAGDCRNVPLFAGVPYMSRFVLSPQVMREDAGGGQGGAKLAVTEGRLQLRSITFTYGDTGYFEVLVTPEYRRTDRRVFSGRVMGHGSNTLGQVSLSSGTFRTAVLSQADKARIEIVSDSFLPFQITSAGWEGYFHIRSQRRT